MSGTSMRPNVLLMCKLLVLLLLAHKFVGKIDEPFIPLWPVLDGLRTPSDAWIWLARAAFVGAAAALLANVAVRTASVVVGAVVIVCLLGSLPLFRNHLFICGCLLVLAGLHRRDEPPWLLYAQMSLVYLGACVNKLFEPDWWDGRFMHNWLFTARGEPLYAAVLTLVPGRGAAMLLSWIAMATELIVGLALLVRKTRAFAAVLILSFHGVLFVCLRGERFGHFLEDILIALLMFLPWPAGVLELRANARWLAWLTPVLRALDWERRVRVQPTAGGTTGLMIDGREWHGLSAVRRTLGVLPGFYVVVFVCWNFAFGVLPHQAAYVLVTAIGVGVAALFVPVEALWRGPRRAPATSLT